MFKNLKVMTTLVCLTAIAIVLGFFKISLSPTLEIRFMQIPIAIAGGVFGIIPGAVVGILSDIGAYIVRPTGIFFPGFMITAAITGIIYGLFFYKRKVGIVKLSIVEIIRTLIVGMILNTWFLTMITGLPFNVLLFSRIVKELVMIPINVALIYLIFKLFKKNYEL